MLFGLKIAPATFQPAIYVILLTVQWQFALVGLWHYDISEKPGGTYLTCETRLDATMQWCIPYCVKEVQNILQKQYLSVWRHLPWISAGITIHQCCYLRLKDLMNIYELNRSSDCATSSYAFYPTLRKLPHCQTENSVISPALLGETHRRRCTLSKNNRAEPGHPPNVVSPAIKRYLQFAHRRLWSPSWPRSPTTNANKTRQADWLLLEIPQWHGTRLRHQL